MTSEKSKWICKYTRRRDLLKRSTLLNLFTVREFHEYNILRIAKPEVGKSYPATDFVKEISPDAESTYTIIQEGNFIYGLEMDGQNGRAICLVEKGNPIISAHEKFFIEKGDIENYSGAGEFTTYGRYICNYFTTASIFGSMISYKNSEIKISSLEEEIGTYVLNNEIKMDQLNVYMDQTFFLGSLTEIAVPVYTRKSLTTDPNVEKRRKELLDQYRDQLHDPVVCSKIEDELIQMDKDYLKGDPSMGFFGSSGKKFNVHRKRQHITVGLFENFQKEKGKYSFVEGALIDGWEKKAFPTLCNEIRRASYSRGIETAQGGVQTKYLLRIFQNLKLISEDCGTKRGLTVTFTKENIKDFYGCYIIQPSGKLEPLSSRNAKAYLDRTVKIRSTMFCEEKDGYCFTCAGDSYRNLDIKAIGATALELGAAFLTQSMKSMHGTKMSSFEVTDLDKFVV